MFFKSPDAEVTEQNSAKICHVFIRTKTKLLSASVTFLTPLNPLLPASCCLSSTVGPCLSLFSPLSLSTSLAPSLGAEVNHALRPCSHCVFSATSVWGLCVPLISRGAMLSLECVSASVRACVCVCPLPSLRSHTGRPAWEVSAALHHPLHHHHLTPL